MAGNTKAEPRTSPYSHWCSKEEEGQKCQTIEKGEEEREEHEEKKKKEAERNNKGSWQTSWQEHKGWQ
eukprot:4722451-Prorocentrum_lima.AAC.1